MCTLTIRRKNDQTLVTMNRDEQRARDNEREPFLWNQPNIFAPQDMKANGTWIGMNREGVIAALLNGYQTKDNDFIKKTRGEIVPLVLSGKEIDPAQYASFHLVKITQKNIWHSYWDGQSFEQKTIPQEEWNFFTSSSWKQNDVMEGRSHKFHKWVKKGAVITEYLPAIHVQHDDKQKAESVLMARDDACTKSITQFGISNAGLTCRYWSKPQENLDFKQYQGLF